MLEAAKIYLNVPPAVKAAWVRQSRISGLTLTEWVLKHVEQFSIPEIVKEAGSLAESLADSPIFSLSPQAGEGIQAMTQAVAAFEAATDDAERRTAGLWLADAYLLFSSSLPDTGFSEIKTGWETANQLSKILGGVYAWQERVKAQYRG